MTITVKVLLGIAVVGAVVGGVVVWRRRSQQKRPMAEVQEKAIVAQMPAAVAAGTAPSPRIVAKKRGSRFARFGSAALRGGKIGVRAAALAGVPGAGQVQEFARLV